MRELANDWPRAVKNYSNRDVARGGMVQPSTRTPHERVPHGRMIVVTCADPSRLDFLLRAVERHLGARSGGDAGSVRTVATLVEPVVTRKLPAGGGVVVKSSRFNALAKQGALALSWEQGGRCHGFTVTTLARLATGENVIAGMPQAMEQSARDAWPEARIVRLSCGTERLRERLAPRGTLARLGGAAAYDVQVHDCGDAGEAIRRLAAAIVALLPLQLHDDVAVADVAAGEVVSRPRRARTATGHAALAAATPRGKRAGKVPGLVAAERLKTSVFPPT